MTAPSNTHISADDLRVLRQKFRTNKNHQHLPEASLIADKSSTAMFNLAGMQQLIPYFSGKKHPLGRRLFNIQKCVRTIDIDEVGDDTHLTMFEMMGNRSLGDYFKKESIQRSRDFLTSKERLGLDPKKIAITVFAGDDNAPRDEESAAYWKEVGVEKISYLGADDNRRSPGPVGPCGPDTEIFYRIGEGVPPADSDVASDPDNWMEIWNNVFMQYYRDENGKLTKLSAQSVDTGMGFERMCMVLQKKTSPYSTDIFSNVFEKLPSGTTGWYLDDDNKNKELLENEQNKSNARIFVDHMRTSLLLIYSGVIPSNTGPGYVLRSLIRRAYFLHIYYDSMNSFAERNDQVQKSLESMQAHWEKFYNISIPSGSKIITEEITKFQKTLKGGYKEFQKIIDLTEGNVIEGKKVFFLSDTFGFPIELTKKLAQDAGMTIDEAGFRAALEEQKNRSRKATKGKFSIDVDRSTHIQGIPATEFVGYDTLVLSDNVTSTQHQFENNKSHQLVLGRSIGEVTVIPARVYPDHVGEPGSIDSGTSPEGQNTYTSPPASSKGQGVSILKDFTVKDQRVLVFDKTPFYAEGGGQTGDQGTITLDTGETLQVTDVKNYEGIFLHFVQ